MTYLSFSGSSKTNSRPTQAEAEWMFETLVLSIKNYAINMLDPLDLVVSLNTGAERFKCYSADINIGRHFSLSTPHKTSKHRFQSLPCAQPKCKGASREMACAQTWHTFVCGHFDLPCSSPRWRLLGFAKLTRDVTERNKSQASLLRREQHFGSLGQSVTDYAYISLSRRSCDQLQHRRATQ